MIAKLFGRVDSTGADHAVIDVSGVGYLVFCSSRTLQYLTPSPAESAALFIETVVREDHIHLYGFWDEAERAWFNALRSVQGVGTRVALGVLSTLPPDVLSQAIQKQDRRLLTRAPSIGPKLAGRIATELKEKVKTLPVGMQQPASAHAADVASVPRTAARAAAAVQPSTVSSPDRSSMLEDAVSALINLGYRPMEAEDAVRMAEPEMAAGLNESAMLAELIRVGLRNLAR